MAHLKKKTKTVIVENLDRFQFTNEVSETIENFEDSGYTIDVVSYSTVIIGEAISKYSVLLIASIMQEQ